MVPAFEAYPARIERSRAASIQFRSDANARTFRSRLSEALRGGVNFAGHYIIAGWGCGTGCVSGAVIDARTGLVYWPEQFSAISAWFDDGGYAGPPITYRRNSRLLVIKGVPGSDNDDGTPARAGEYYYEWKDNRLRFLKFIEKKKN